MNHDHVAESFSKKVISLTLTVYFTGMQHFEGHPFQQGLAAVFCHAVRFTLLNELEDRTQSSADVLGEVINCLPPSTPHEAIDTFQSLAPSEFEQWYKSIRSMAEKEGVVITEFAKALSSAQEIARWCAR